MAGAHSRSRSSSRTRAYDVEKNIELSTKDNNIDKLRTPDELDIADQDGSEHGELLPGPQQKKPEEKITSVRTSIAWMVVNTAATIAIVFTNKAIFDTPSLKLVQVSFATFHFFITWLTLFALSRPRFGIFQARKVSIREILPLATTMALNVILPNFSLAFSSVTFYQIARILLTPVTAVLNYALYGVTLPRRAVLALVPACAGVGLVSYYDSLPAADARVKTTSPLGVAFALAGIGASSLYTVWIASYHKKLQMSSMQLLHNQAPVAAVMLLYVIPFVDTFPVWSAVGLSKWTLVFMSGLFAALINMSQFFIVAQTGPVSSTVVGHLKTCSIVALGWLVSGRAVGDMSIVGVLVAIGGIVTYSIIMLRHKGQQKV